MGHAVSPPSESAFRQMRRVVKLAEENRLKASQRGEKVRARVVDQIARGKRTVLDGEIEAIIDQEIVSDPFRRAYIADNQWFMQQAIMWATVAQAELALEQHEQSGSGIQHARPSRAE